MTTKMISTHFITLFIIIPPLAFTQLVTAPCCLSCCIKYSTRRNVRQYLLHTMHTLSIDLHRWYAHSNSSMHKVYAHFRLSMHISIKVYQYKRAANPVPWLIGLEIAAYSIFSHILHLHKIRLRLRIVYCFLHGQIRKSLLRYPFRITVRTHPLTQAVYAEDKRHSVMDWAYRFDRFSCYDSEHWYLDTSMLLKTVWEFLLTSFSVREKKCLVLVKRKKNLLRIYELYLMIRRILP